MSTPIRQQYLQIKRQYPDTVLLFRLGDFYETFDDDARLISRELGIVLTSRPVGKDHRVPLAGVPYHAVDGYIAKLIAKGYKVAICEQLGDDPVKGLVPRGVVRVVTPGTVVEPAILDERSNNYLAALIIEGDRAAVAYADISTGEFATTQFADGRDLRRSVLEELTRLGPAECLLPQSVSADACKWLVMPERTMSVSPYENWHFDYDNARRALLDHFGVASLAGYGCEGLPLAVQAAGALIQYLQDTQKGALKQLVSLMTYSVSEFMVLDPATRRNLELTQTIRSGASRGSLLNVLDKTSTVMGARVLRRWLSQPLLKLMQLNSRLDAVQSLYDNSKARTELADCLKGVADLERVTNRVVQRIATPRDLVGISRSLEVIPRLKGILAAMSSEGSRPLEHVEKSLDPCGQFPR